MKKLFVLLTLFLFFTTSNSHAQDLLESRKSSSVKHIFRITPEQAETIYRKGAHEVDDAYFQNLIATYHLDSGYYEELPIGHYLYVHVAGNRVDFELETVNTLQVNVLDNHRDLIISVHEKNGKVAEGAKVKLKKKSLHFDKKLQAFRLGKANKHGLLKVSYQGEEGYYNVEQYGKSSRYKRISSKILYSVPLRYVWIPLRFIIFIPIDGVRSIVHHSPTGSIYWFVKQYRKIFERDYYDYNRYNSDKHRGYMVFNQPKYRQGDTVKIKAFIVNKKGKPVDKKLDLVLSGGGKNIDLDFLEPYTAGGYSYEFVLHDSLGLRLDSYCSIRLENEDGDSYISGAFRYEDYELKSATYTLRTVEKEHFRGRPFSLIMQGKDENDLNIMDGRFVLSLTTNHVSRFYPDSVFVPDTLWTHRQALDPVGETKLTIPDSIFPQTNLIYKINVDFLTSDNEKIHKSKNVSYWFENKEIKFEEEGDRLSISYHKNGETKTGKAILEAYDSEENLLEERTLELPIKVQINPFVAEYWVETDSTSNWHELGNGNISISGYRTADSVFFAAQNPSNIPFTWQLYSKNSEVARGNGKELNLRKSVGNKKTYSIRWQYIYGGKAKNGSATAQLFDNQLNLKVDQPSVIYPGQKASIEVAVTDSKGKPVKDVDVTAYANTKKFGSENHDIPYLGKYRAPRGDLNKFSLKDTKGHDGNIRLQYEEWNKLSKLDSVEYYHFLYPKNKLYKTSFPVEDSVTQFAPFVVDNGKIEPVHVVYLDNKPVYFSFSQQAQPYSFRVDSGYHYLRLRTSTRSIILDSLYFAHGKKTILSVEDSAVAKHISSYTKLNTFSDNEKRSLSRYIFPYAKNHPEQLTYLLQDSIVTKLNHPKSYRYGRRVEDHTSFVGPVSSAPLQFVVIDSFNTKFNHESNFEYDFQKGLLKMREKDTKSLLPKRLSNSLSTPSFTGRAYTVKQMEDSWEAYLKRNIATNRIWYDNATSTEKGNGWLKIELEHESPDSLRPLLLNTFIFTLDDPDFLRLYPGKTNRFHQLKPGTYRMVFLFDDHKYWIQENVNIRPNGANFQRVKIPQELKQDEFSDKLTELIKRRAKKPYTGTPLKQEVQQVYRETQYTNSAISGNVVRGTVLSTEDGEPLPGVSILVKGTTYGTTSDIDGNYELAVPNYNSILIFSFIGCVTKEIQVSQNFINVSLDYDLAQLEEVVVIGYGTQKRRELTGAVFSIKANQSLQGRVAGVSVNQNIMIRGTSSLGESSPLYVIDGMVYDAMPDGVNIDDFASMEVLKDASATAIYGARAANGVILISMKEGKGLASQIIGGEAKDAFWENAAAGNSLRTNFADYAFWQPRLRTNKEGKASFEVTFPDDITNWKTYYLAMNDQKQSGYTSGEIRSFRPLSAKMATPRFLVVGDSVNFVGKAMNYTADTLDISTFFLVEGEKVLPKNLQLANAAIDSIYLEIADKDSLKIGFQVEKADGYFDGEEKGIPIFPVGTKETKGQFLALYTDTVFQLPFTHSNKVTLRADANLLSIAEQEIKHVLNYKYLCNEQLASKLKALVAKTRIDLALKREIIYAKDIQKIITRLENTQRTDGTWGWWENTDRVDWITLHVWEALAQANEIGYSNKLDKELIKNSLVWEIDRAGSRKKMKIIELLMALNVPFAYKDHLQKIEADSVTEFTLGEKFKLIRIRQKLKLPYDLKIVEESRKETLFGDYYWGEESRYYAFAQNPSLNTALAYRILKADSTDEFTMRKVRSALVGMRKDGFWQNTYISSYVLESILPDLLGDTPGELPDATLTLSGAANVRLTSFPYTTELNQQGVLNIKKGGKLPVYLSVFEEFWQPNPTPVDSAFTVRSYFDLLDTASTELKAGEAVKLKVEVVVKKKSEYVMIEVPIPAGCTYENKRQYYYRETHREYFRNQTSIFCQDLPADTYEFEVELLPRYSGKYTLNPVRAEQMYFPVFYGRNGLKRVVVE
ncbi:carboxypeptidase-like regulatory domain-containing protein [Flammeovirgaceae bacterium SG7u.111]|nr:carboxypeptidase-like regulatory domain-containing protein [Flammeovirgaceae bacterium SG7u.132]WPO33329.1 carboxypeptidase-like regulatory domain-containing protein [Flammeovirgaceae bacterium SG7u.111]